MSIESGYFNLSALMSMKGYKNPMLFYKDYKVVTGVDAEGRTFYNCIKKV